MGLSGHVLVTLRGVGGAAQGDTVVSTISDRIAGPGGLRLLSWIAGSATYNYMHCIGYNIEHFRIRATRQFDQEG